MDKQKKAAIEPKDTNSLQNILLTVSRLSYKYIFNPIATITPVDKSHHLAIEFGSRLGNLKAVRRFSQMIYKNTKDERLRQNLHGIQFDSPVGLSAGYDKSGKVAPIVSTLGFGFSTIGSVTAEKCDGNPKPWFYRLSNTQSIVVNAGLNNDGSIAIIDRLHNYGTKIVKQFPIILSVAKTNSRKIVDMESGIADYVSTVSLAKNEELIKIIELNISCPNAYGGEPFTTPYSLDLLLRAVMDTNVKKPIFIKMPIYLPWDAFKSLLDVAIKNNVSGVVISNLIKDRTKVKEKDKLPDNIRGFLSGRPTWESSNKLIQQTYLAFGDKLTIIGSGGIFSAQDAYTKIKLGASLVETITGFMFCGPQLPSQINNGLLYLLEKDGYTHIGQAVGADAAVGRI